MVYIKNYIKGFTLVELVIVMAVAVILSMISVPIYKDYTYKAHIAEGYMLIGAIRDAQMQYYNEYERFIAATDAGSSVWSSRTSVSEVLGIDARMNKYFTSFNVNQQTNTYVRKDLLIVVQSAKYGGITLYKSLTDAETYTIN
ncbi:MAG: pilin [Elusimicrobia bacterium]|nr:pilin [Elusimicrobiota bacterium]